jgi:hypothetical protein
MRRLALAAPLFLLMAATALAAPRAIGDAELSSNWAGYVATAPADTTPIAFTDVTATWVVPRIRCTKTSGTSVSFWVGIGGHEATSPSLEQLGSAADCLADGTARYYLWTESYPAPVTIVPRAVRAGDRLTAAVSIDGRDVAFSIKNSTLGTRYSTREQIAHALDTDSAEWIVETPSFCRSASDCNPAPLARFGSVTFSNIATIGDAHPGTLADPAWHVNPIVLVPEKDAAVYTTDPGPGGAVPGPLDAAGRTFGVTYRTHGTTASR